MEIMTVKDDGSPRTLLWVDDDDPGRYLYETQVIQSSGEWQIEWAQNPERAAHELASKAYRAVILDQLMPVTMAVRERSPWAGYLLLCWLRERPIEDWLEPALHEAIEHIKRASAPPLVQNKTAPVLILSAFDYKRAVTAIRQINKPYQANTRILIKPIDLKDVLDWLGEIK
jgi:CheY-like chemotaxis protein